MNQALNKLALLGLFFGSGATNIYAQQAATTEEDLVHFYGDEEVVEIATGSSKPIRLAPSVASVITAEEIQAMGATTLDEALESVPGLHVGRSANRLNAIYSMRGIHTKENPQVLVLINGFRISSLFTGGRAPTFRLPVENIARIEVIRGPGSALYGADAFSGVINIITKSMYDIDGLDTGVRVGSFDSRDVWLQYGGLLGNWETSFSLEYSKSDGDRGRTITSDLQTTLDNSFGTTASLAPGPLDSRYDIITTNLKVKQDNWSFGWWSWIQNDAGLGPGAAQTLDHIGSQDVAEHLFDVDYNNAELADNLVLGAKLSYHHMVEASKFIVFPPGALIPIGANGNINFASPAGLVSFPDGLIGKPGATYDELGAELTLLYSGFSKHNLRLGVGYKDQKLTADEAKNTGPGVIDGSKSPVNGDLTNVTGTPYIFIQDQNRRIKYIFGQDEWAFTNDWELTAGVRYDDYSDFGDTVNPRLALVWTTSQFLTTKFLYGEAFRAPSFSEQHTQNNSVTLGNPNVQPETIKTLEVLFDYRPLSILQTQLGLFSYDINNLIDFVPDPGGSSSTAQNSHGQKGHGLEFETRWKISKAVRLNTNFAWQHSEDKVTGADIADAPAKQLYVAVFWQMNTDWDLGGQAKWIAGRRRAGTDSRPEISNYTVVNMVLRYKKRNTHWELSAYVKNLFDEDAREPSNGLIADDYPLEGRSAYLEVRYNLGQ